MSFMEEHPNAAITVVVDATFGHRIDKKEIPEFEAGISNNELVAPPAGAIGRGDAFVLSIAQKAKASILSNDSFQEFHADYEWLFEFKGVTPEGALATLATIQPTSRFGEMFQYSNLLAGAAGFVGGHVSFPKLELGYLYSNSSTLNPDRLIF